MGHSATGGVELAMLAHIVLAQCNGRDQVNEGNLAQDEIWNEKARLIEAYYQRQQRTYLLHATARNTRGQEL